MKSIIYAGAGLFIVASAFGLADYYGAKKSGKIESLYREDESEQAASAVPEKKQSDVVTLTSVAEQEMVQDKSATSKNEVKKEKQKKKKSIPEIKSEWVDPITIAPPVVMEEKIVEDVAEKPAVIDSSASTNVTADEKFAFKAEMFSRAPLSKKRFKNKKQ